LFAGQSRQLALSLANVAHSQASQDAQRLVDGTSSTAKCATGFLATDPASGAGAASCIDCFMPGLQRNRLPCGEAARTTEALNYPVKCKSCDGKGKIPGAE
jgi:hypothetical protein